MTDTPTRRIFIRRGIACGSTLLLATLAPAAQAAPHVEETDENAVGLGYRHDTTKVDHQRFPRHDPAQHCAGCAFFQGASGDEWGGCAMFGRKHIAASGWCTAWAKKPG